MKRKKEYLVEQKEQEESREQGKEEVETVIKCEEGKG